MGGKTLKFYNIKYDKKEFHKSKQPINLDLINADQIAVSDNWLVTKKIKLLNSYVLPYLKWVDT